MERHPHFTYSEQPQEEPTKPLDDEEFLRRAAEDQEQDISPAREKLKTLEGKTIVKTEIDRLANVTITFDDGTTLKFEVWHPTEERPWLEGVQIDSP